MSIVKQITAVQALRKTAIVSMEKLMDTDEGLDEAEQKKFDDFESEIKTLDHRLANLERTEQLIVAEKATSVVPAPVTPAIVTPQLEQDKTLFIARQAHALFMAGGNRLTAAMYAKNTLGDDLLAKTLEMPADVIQRATVIPGASGTVGFAAELVQINQANSAFIELLRPMSIVARFPGRNMAFDGAGSIKIPRQTVGSTGGWVDEGDAIKVDRLTLDSITLTPKKNGNIIAVSKELLARSTPSAMQLIRDDILAGVATAIDTQFVSSDSTAGRPAGIQTYDGTPTASTGDALANILADLKAAIGAMLAVNMPMVSPVWILHPVILNSLRFIQDGLGNRAFKDEIDAGMLVGYPFLTSTTCTQTVVMLVDGNQVIMATEMAPEISVSEDATIHMSDAPDNDLGGGGTATPVQSMFQTDSVAIKTTTRGDWAARYAECVQSITSVTW